MKVFIFGAGASLGSQGVDFERLHVKAPLVSDLADPRYSDIADYVGLSQDFLSSLQAEILKSNKSLEQCLTDRWDKINTLNSESKKRTERKFFGQFTFYLWRLLQGVSETYHDGMNKNIYKEFIRKLNDNDEEYGFISFNYDTLLDQAYQEVGAAVLANTLLSYKASNYIKPHGSVNWFLKLRTSDPKFPTETAMDIPGRFGRASTLIFNSNPISMGEAIVVDPGAVDLKDPKFIASPLFGGQYAYPLLFLPTISKQYAWVQGFSDEIILEGRELIKKAKEIYLIGYRAQDDIIRELFSTVQSGATLNVVGFDDVNEIRSNVLGWRKELKPGAAFHKGFESFVASYR